jgi:hypothetical protein
MPDRGGWQGGGQRARISLNGILTLARRAAAPRVAPCHAVAPEDRRSRHNGRRGDFVRRCDPRIVNCGCLTPAQGAKGRGQTLPFVFFAAAPLRLLVAAIGAIYLHPRTPPVKQIAVVPAGSELPKRKPHLDLRLLAVV